MRTVIRRALLLAALLTLVPATTAGAATFTPADGDELQAALSTAALTFGLGDDDTIVLDAATTYTRPAGFAYSAPASAKLTLTGNGATVTASGVGAAIAAFDGGTIDISSLKVQATIGFDTGFLTQYSGTNVTVDDVSVNGQTSGAGSSSGMYLGGTSVTATKVASSALASTGIQSLATSAALTGVQVSGATSRQIQASGGTAEVTDADLRDPGSSTATGVEVEGAVTALTVRRARIADAMTATRALFSGHLTVSDSLILLPDAYSSALQVGDVGNAAAFSSTVDAQRLTIVGTENAGQRAAVAGDGSTNEADHHTITLTDSIVAAVPDALVCSEPSGQPLPDNEITINRTRLPAGGMDNTCGDGPSDPGITLSPGVTSADPVFADPAAGDYRPLYSSPLLDLGDTSDPLVGADLAGGLRFVGGAVDLGAYEYQRTPPEVTVSATPAAPVAGQPTTLTATATDADPGESAQLTYAWSFSDGTTATGLAPLHVFPLVGPATATVTVTDPTGQQATKALQLSVVAPPAGSLDKPAGGATPDADTTIPRLTGLRVAKRIRRGATLPGAVTGGGQVRFTLSEAASVSVRFERLRGKRATRVPGTFTLKLGAGARGLRFAGRISSTRKLKPGTYRIVLTPTDATGNVGATSRATFTLR